MTHISKESWKADCGIDNNGADEDDFSIIIYNQKRELVAVVHGKTIKQVKERADAIAELPDIIDENF